MANTTLNIKVVPRRLLNAGDAADYCGLPVKHFLKFCTVGYVEMPNGGKLYDMRDLDTWIDALKSGNSTDDDALLERLG